MPAQLSICTFPSPIHTPDFSLLQKPTLCGTASSTPKGMDRVCVGVPTT